MLIMLLALMIFFVLFDMTSKTWGFMYRITNRFGVLEISDFPRLTMSCENALARTTRAFETHDCI